jgi:hypothetical protein
MLVAPSVRPSARNNAAPNGYMFVKFYIGHFHAYAQYSKRDPTYAKCYHLFIKLCLLVPQHISENIYASIKGYYYELRKMCIK